MGTWDSGNFDNDTACDYIIDLCEPIIECIRNTVQNETSMEPDEAESEILLCNMEILYKLANSLNTYQAKVAEQEFPMYICELPDSKEASDWKSKYLSVWDNCIDDLDPDEEYKIQRRKVIEETFDNFIKLTRNFED